MTRQLSTADLKQCLTEARKQLVAAEKNFAAASLAALSAPTDPAAAETQAAAARAVTNVKSEVAAIEAALGPAGQIEFDRAAAKAKAEYKELKRKTEAALKDLIEGAISFQVATERLAAAHARMTSAGNDIQTLLLRTPLQAPQYGFFDAISRNGLERAAGQHLKRQGNIPGVPPHPFSLVGTPTLPDEMKSWRSAILSALDNLAPRDQP